ncbi:hypothetical protein EXS71_03805 [Candidatus Uhrbacteria bacterium]|nr:hypothetical protein [Candidatus Uhrbacteria bacterium]
MNNDRLIKQRIQSIRMASQEITPDLVWMKKTRETLLMQVANGLPEAPVPFFQRVREATRSFISADVLRAIRQPLMTTLSILGLLIGGSIASVSAAERSVPGDFLHPIKLAAEQAQLAFTSGRTGKLRLKTQFLGRRVAEIQQIVSSNLSQKPERINAAADILKRDLDTVKTQLHEVTNQESVGQVVEAAKFVDQKSSEAASALKTVKPDAPLDAQNKIGEAEAAAVNAGVQAIQVLVESHSQPGGENTITNDELIQSIHGKVQGIEDNIIDAANKILSSASSTNAGSTSSTSSLSIINVSTSSSMAQILDAKNSLAQAKQLLQEEKLDQVTDKLAQTVKVIAVAEQIAEAANANASSSLMLLPTSTSVSSTLLVSPSSTRAVSGSSTTTSSR